MTVEMHTTFQRLCIRPEVGFVYDKNSMLEIADGISFSELLGKATSKCDTALLLLSSHKGKIKDFTVKVVGIENPQNLQSGVMSSVLSGVKKGFSFLNSSSINEDQTQNLSDVEQVSEAWVESQENGYHGLQVLTLIDKDTMPDNDSRKLYNLHQFVTILLQSINAYYMFQKPDVSFLYDMGFNAEELKDLYPKADTFALAVVWKFVEDPLEQSVSSSLRRATPIVSSTMSSPRTQRLMKGKDSSFYKNYDSPKLAASLAIKKKIEEKRQALLREINETPDSKPRRKVGLSPVDIVKNRKSLPMEESQESEDEEEDLPSPPPKTVGRTRCLKPSPSTGNIIFPKIIPLPKTISPPKSFPLKTSTRGRRTGLKLVAPVVLDIEIPSVRKIKQSNNKQVPTVRSSRRGTKRTVAQATESEEEDEITVNDRSKIMKHVESMEIDENTDTNNTDSDTLLINPDNIALPDETAPKVRIGRKSMVASARKSLANEWPLSDQENMLHFFDNLNPGQSETSRIALTCKYALIHDNRDLSSKLLFQWVEKKGRPIQREVTDFALKEENVKSTVLELFKSLCDIQTEATRVSFTLKFMQSQYNASVSSKLLFGWLHDKSKKGKK